MSLKNASEPSRLALVVDDDPVLRLAVKQFVERLGFNTLEAADGRAAVALFADQEPDVVLLDAAMPELDGFAACAEIRALPAGKRVPILVITVYEDEASVDRAFDAGADEYITKPIHWAVLRNRVLHLVSAYHAERRLRDDHAFFQCLVDSIPEPTVVVDRDLVVRWINGAAPSFFLLEAARLGSPLALRDSTAAAERGRSEGAQLLSEMLSRAVTEDETIDCILSCRGDDSEHLYAQLSVRVLRGVRGDAHGFILRLQDVTARERERKALQKEASLLGNLARHDSLTGLANRRGFEERLRTLLAERDAGGMSQAALLFLDLDGFKEINDTHGHAAGDRLLCTIAGRLEALVRRSDLVARLGGDEFAILLVDAGDRDAIAALAGRLLESIRLPVQIDGAACLVSASIGIGVYPSDAPDPRALMARADAAMYRVKEAGKNGFRFAEPAADVA